MWMVGVNDWCAPCSVVNTSWFYGEYDWCVHVQSADRAIDWSAQRQSLELLQGRSAWVQPRLLSRAARGERVFELETPLALTLSQVLSSTKERAPVPPEIAATLLSCAAEALATIPRIASGVSLGDLALTIDGRILAVPRLLVFENEGYGLGPTSAPWQLPLPSFTSEREHRRVLELLGDALDFIVDHGEDALERARLQMLASQRVASPEIVGWLRSIVPDAMDAMENLEDEATLARDSRANDVQGTLQRAYRVFQADNDVMVVRRDRIMGPDIVLTVQAPDDVHRFAMRGEEVIVGSSELCDVAIGHPSVEARHLRVRYGRDHIAYVRAIDGELFYDAQGREPVHGVHALHDRPVYFAGNFSLSASYLDDDT